MKFFLGVICGWLLGLILATTWSVSAQTALDQYLQSQHARQEVDLILVDILMPDMDGLQLIPLLRETRPACKIIAMSGGLGERDYLDTAKRLGANDTLKKPFSPQDLLDAVSSQLGQPDPASGS
jgi:CheY-like chemotaxis protein